MLHEMNNPVTSIKLCIELLEGGDEDAKEHYYSIIKKSIEVLESSIRQISNSFIEEGFTVHLKVKDELLKEL